MPLLDDSRRENNKYMQSFSRRFKTYVGDTRYMVSRWSCHCLHMQLFCKKIFDCLKRVLLKCVFCAENNVCESCRMFTLKCDRNFTRSHFKPTST